MQKSHILEPITVSNFKQLINEVVQKIQHNQTTGLNVLTVRTKDGLVHINKNDIIFIEALNHTSIIHTHLTVFESRISLNELEMMLGTGFLRVHRSFIVNLTKIKKTRVTFDRSYEIYFYDYPKQALMSRYRYPNYLKHFQLQK